MLIALIALIALACGGAGASPVAPSGTPTTAPATPSPPQPSDVPAPTAPPAGEVSTAAQAVAIVLASEPRFAGIGPLRSDMVGQSAWYEAFATGDGFNVAVTIGSGDCQSGCIDRHTWTYLVAPDGTLTLTGDEGDEVEFSPPQPTGETAAVTVHLTSGPICPVEVAPPDPSCAERPVVGAAVSVYNPGGNLVVRGESDAAGEVAFELPTGAYYVEAEPVEGLMSAPEAQAFSAVGGHPVGIVMAYDTGIR